MDKDLTEVEKLAEWKDKKQRNRDNKLKNSKKIFVRRRKWRDEVDEIKELEKSYEEVANIFTEFKVMELFQFLGENNLQLEPVQKKIIYLHL